MGVTIVNKRPQSDKKDGSKIALVLAGGTFTGGAFKIGGLKALNDFLLNKKLTDFEMYVGLSAGAFLAAPLAGGITPDEILESLDGRSKKFTQLSPFDIYKPNWRECIGRPLKFLYGHLTFVPGMIYDLASAWPNLKDDFWSHIKNLVRQPNYSNYEQLMAPILRVLYATRSLPLIGELLPSGIFDNAPLERFIRSNLKRNRLSNHFKVLKRVAGRSLYIGAMNLDTSERVIFGPDDKNDVTISQAIQASTAIPGFYKPARIKGVDYVDGAVRRTANIDIAFDKGADLVLCYNPFIPFNNEVFLEYLREENKYVTKSKRLADSGIAAVLSQVLRTLFHSRLMYAVQTYRDDPNFKKDLVLVEPTEETSEFLEMNPLFFWNRARAASHGFRAVARSLDTEYDKLSPLLKKYGVEMTRNVPELDQQKVDKTQPDDVVVMDIPEERVRKSRLRVVEGGQ